MDRCSISEIDKTAIFRSCEFQPVFGTCVEPGDIQAPAIVIEIGLDPDLDIVGDFGPIRI